MERSEFQFTNPALKRLEFVIHDGFVKKGRLNMEIKFNVNFQREEIDDHTMGNSALVTLTACVGSKDDSTPFYIEADEEANFRWAEGAYTEEQIEDLLNQNAVALLISYLRPIISNVTAASPYPAYNLPYVNLTKRN